MTGRLRSAPFLLFGSGAAALVYETVWLREFRLIFGASTAASAAVVAIFVGGLGAGGWWIGKIAERNRNPLTLYSLLELGVTLMAVLTAALIPAVRILYNATGGSFVLGGFVATVLRLILAAIVLGGPTFLMGGTLPAMARAVEQSSDAGRSAVAMLYGANTLGAVAGAAVSTFFLLEYAGNLGTLLAAAMLNALVGGIAFLLASFIRGNAKKGDALRDEIDAEPEADAAPAVASPRFVYAAAAATGFVFFVMELVWYRMLTPLLGGTTFTFGAILAVALFGIGAGSALSSMRRERATLVGFAICSALEALALAIPFATGDGIALFALFTRALGTIGFRGFVLSWLLVAAFVVLPAAFASGVQFPMLISLLGRGRENVALHVGRAYAWNTIGSIAGSLAGGFGALPLLTAPGTWRVAFGVLVVVVIATAIHGARQRGAAKLTFAVAIAAASVALITAKGPTAFWRHTPIGAGRAETPKGDANRLIDFVNARRRTTFWEADGIESSISVSDTDGYALLVNGKGDGHARLDGGTQIMSGILPALLHPNPRRAVVVGLGTGTSAGWLAEVSSIERVDVIEIEPAIKHVAELCAPVNRNALANPKVHLAFGDGREFLLGRGDKVDIITAEPSNPYRAGVASLYTSEFYRACLRRLAPRGIFVQFLQAYEVDAPTIRTVYATLTSVFPHVETWQTQSGDLLLVGSVDPLAYDDASLRAKLQIDAVRNGVRNAWWADDPESIAAHYVCGNRTARVLAFEVPRNTDNRTIVEYAFARSVGTSEGFRIADLREAARIEADSMPQFVRDPAQVQAVELRRMTMGIAYNDEAHLNEFLGERQRLIAISEIDFIHGDLDQVWTLWQSLGANPSTALETLMYAQSLAGRGDDKAVPFIARLATVAPVEADVLTAQLRWRQRRIPESLAALNRALTAYRTNPWPLTIVMHSALSLVNEITRSNAPPAVIAQAAEGVSEPFAVGLFEEDRKSALLLAQMRLSPEWQCSQDELRTIRSYEPDVPWQEPFLAQRAKCYESAHDPLAATANRDLTRYRSAAPKRLTGGMSIE